MRAFVGLGLVLLASIGSATQVKVNELSLAAQTTSFQDPAKMGVWEPYAGSVQMKTVLLGKMYDDWVLLFHHSESDGCAALTGISGEVGVEPVIVTVVLPSKPMAGEAGLGGVTMEAKDASIYVRKFNAGFNFAGATSNSVVFSGGEMKAGERVNGLVDIQAPAGGADYRIVGGFTATYCPAEVSVEEGDPEHLTGEDGP